MEEYPLVSCLLPTENRARFVNQAIHFFMSQDYPNKELIILYSKEADLPEDIVYPPNVTAVCTGLISLGAKRNYPINFAKGTYIAQWDDDDIYHPSRLSQQLELLRSGAADITGLHNIIIYDVKNENCHSSSTYLFKLLFGHIACGTMAFKKDIWGKLTEYPDIKSGEDSEFLLKALKNGARLRRVNGQNLYIYLRHSTNTWNIPAYYFGNPRHYRRIVIPEWALPYEHFYKDKSLFIV